MYTFNENLQRGILYLSKSDEDFYSQAAHMIKPHFFDLEMHGNIFDVITTFKSKYNSFPTDDCLLSELTNRTNKIVSLDSYEQEIQFINNIDKETLKNKNYILDKVEEFAKISAIKDAMVESLEDIQNNKLGSIEARIRKALLTGRDVDLGLDYYDDPTKRWDALYNPSKTLSFESVLPTLDASIEGGLRRKELAVVVAPPSVGKSLFLVNQAAVSILQDYKVLYISLEMSEERVASRLDAILTKCNAKLINQKRDTVKSRLETIKNNRLGSGIYIKEFPTGLANVNNIRSLITQLKNSKNFVPDLIIVDYLELLRPVNSGMAEYEAQQRIAEELRGLAIEQNCLVWTATQTNREGSSTDIITDKHYGDSYGKGRVVDVSVSLNQTAEDYDNGRMNAYIIKARNGKKGILIPMKVNYNNLEMSEINGSSKIQTTTP